MHMGHAYIILFLLLHSCPQPNARQWQCLVMLNYPVWYYLYLLLSTGDQDELLSSPWSPGDPGGPTLRYNDDWIMIIMMERRCIWICCSFQLEEDMFSCGGEVRGGRVPPPSLGIPPDSLTPVQLRRRHVVAAIIHSENSYVATLQRLINVSWHIIKLKKKNKNWTRTLI